VPPVGTFPVADRLDPLPELHAVASIAMPASAVTHLRTDRAGSLRCVGAEFT
jgi:hypothetical protein